MERDQGGVFGSSSSNGARNHSSSDLSDLTETLQDNAHLLVTSNDSEIIRQTLRLYGSLYLAIFLVFCYVRRKFPSLFNIRSWVNYNGLKCELAQTQTYGFFSWTWRVFHVDDDQLLRNCGMDAVCFLRCLRLGTKLSLVGCINAIWLIPTFYTADGLKEIETDRFVRMSVANLNPASPRFAAVVTAAYITVIASLYLLSQEYNWYIKYRHKFMSLRTPRNFAIYVAGIPESLRSNYALADFFQRNPWKSTVFEATVAMNIPKLEGKVAKREIALQKLEHAMAEEKLKGKVKKHRTFKIKNATSDIKNISQTVESVQEFRKQLDDLNKSISLDIGKVRNSNHRLRCNFAKQKFDSNILRGRTLTPSPEEILADHDIESGGLGWTETSLPVSEDSLQWQSPSRALTESSALEPTPLIAEEIPEEDTHVPAVDFQILPVIKSDDEQDHIEEDNDALHLPLSMPDLENSHGRMSSTDSLSEIGDEEEITQELSHPNETAEDDPARGKVSSTIVVPMEGQPHPFLQLFGMGELEAIGTSTNDRSLSSTLDDPLPDENIDIGDEAQSSLQQYTPCRGVENVPREDECGEFDKGIVPHPQSIVGGTPTMDEEALRTIQQIENPRKDIMSAYRRNPVGKASTRSFQSNSSSSIRSGRSDLSKRASSSVRHIRQSIANNVNVDTVSGGVKKARDLSISGSKAVRDLGVKGSKTVVGGTLKATKMSKKVAEYGLKKAHHEFSENAAALAPMLRIGDEGAPRPAGFVTFKDRYTTQAALQMLQHSSSKSMLVEDAPRPSEVFWRNVGLPDKARRTGSLLSLAATIALCLFWSFPVAFISSLTEVNSLKEKLPRLSVMIDNSPALEMFLALLAPLLLLGLNEGVLPVVLKWFAQWEGHISSPRLEASLFRKLSAFQIIQTFFISTISGSLTSELANMIDNPEIIVQLLANSLPTQSSYFIQLMFVFTFFIHGLELLRVTPLGYALVRRFVGPNLTAKERQRKWSFFYSLEDPPDFWHAETFSQIVLFYVVFFVYSTISPITSVFLLGCFVILESGYRYLFIHNFPTSPDSGGRIWAGFVAMIFTGILIGELTLVGLLLLNEAFYSVPALVPLIIITILFIIFVHPARMHVAKNLPATMCIELDKEESEGNGRFNDFDFLRDQYLQPALKQPLLYPDESSFTSRSSAE